MTRVANWPLELQATVERWRDRRLKWGVSDCCVFGAEVVLALTGVDHRDRLPTVRSRDNAQAALELGGGLEAMVSAVLGPPKPAARAQRGDLVLADLGDGPTVAVCLGHLCAAPGITGLVTDRMPTGDSPAWTV